MVKMPVHEFLVTSMAATVLNIVPFPSSPIAPSGILKTTFGYELRLPEFGDTIYELLTKKGAKVPDLIFINNDKKILVTIECKSEFTFEVEERLTKQIKFYSSKLYEKICSEMFPDLTNREIWIICPDDFCPKISKLCDTLSTDNNTNTIVWGATLEQSKETSHFKKFYGRHLDKKLDKTMETGGFSCSPPRFGLLIDPTLSIGKKVSRIGRRLLASLALSYISEKERVISIENFKDKHKDVTMRTKDLKKCMKYIGLLIPQIGDYNTGTGELILAKKPSLDKVKAKLNKLENMTDEEIKVELSQISKTGIRGIKHPRGGQKTKISDFFSKKNVFDLFSLLISHPFTKKFGFLHLVFLHDK